MLKMFRKGCLLILALAFIGCSGNTGKTGNAGSTSPQYTRLAVTSSTHVGFLVALGAEDCIVGMCDKQYAYHDLPHAQELGSSLQLDAERVMASGAEAILLSSYSDDEKKAEAMRKVGVEPIFIDEWKEETPLGRASWIRQIGALIGKEHEADSIYAAVATAYDSLRSMPHTEEEVQIMSGATWQGTWYVPAGNTYMAHLFRDAHFCYVYQNDSSGVSLPLTFERALMDFREANVWVGAPADNLAELKAMNDHHEWFAAYHSGRVYNFRKRTNDAGANDFWETGVVHPELILKDFLLIRGHQSDSLMTFAKQLK